MITRIKRYIMPLLLTVTVMLFIPKEGFYKKENNILKIELENEIKNGTLYLAPGQGFEIGDFSKKLVGKQIEKKFDNLTYEMYHIWIGDLKGKIKSITLENEDGKKIDIIKNSTNKYCKITEDQYEKLYSFSFINTIIYFIITTFFSLSIYKNKEELTKRDFLIYILGGLILSISLNMKIYNKVMGLFLSFVFFKILKEKRELDKIEIIILLIWGLSFLSEKYGFQHYKFSYEQFQNSLLLIIAIKNLGVTNEERDILKGIFKLSTIIMIIVSIISPNILAGIHGFTYGILAMGLMVLSFDELLHKKENNIFKLLNGICFILGLVGTILSSRRTLMVVIVLWIFYILLKRIKFKQILWIVSTMFLLGIAVKSIFPLQYNQIKIAAESIKDVKDESNLQRLLMWKKSYYIFKENPILGIGTDSFYLESIKDIYPKDKNERFIDTFKHPHNEYLQQLLKSGLIGFLLYCYIFILLLQKIWNNKKYFFEENLFIVYSIFGIFEPYTIRREGIIVFIFLSIAHYLENKEKKKGEIKLYSLIVLLPFIAGLYFNKRFRYYFIIIAVLCIVDLIYKKWRLKNESNNTSRRIWD